MKRPSKKKIAEFVKTKFPDIEFDGIKIVESKKDRCHFQIISYGRMIGQAEFLLNEHFWIEVEKHLNWVFQ